MSGVHRKIALFAALFAAVEGTACEEDLTLDGCVSRLRERGLAVRAYVEALDGLARLLDEHGNSVHHAVRSGLGGGWSDEARWTLQQNPRLHRIFFP